VTRSWMLISNRFVCSFFWMPTEWLNQWGIRCEVMLCRSPWHVGMNPWHGNNYVQQRSIVFSFLFVCFGLTVIVWAGKRKSATRAGGEVQ